MRRNVNIKIKASVRHRNENILQMVTFVTTDIANCVHSKLKYANSGWSFRELPFILCEYINYASHLYINIPVHGVHTSMEVVMPPDLCTDTPPSCSENSLKVLTSPTHSSDNDNYL